MALTHLFPSLFMVASQPNITVAQAWATWAAIRFQISFSKLFTKTQQDHSTKVQNLIMT
jgi:hypothetical protein